MSAALSFGGEMPAARVPAAPDGLPRRLTAARMLTALKRDPAFEWGFRLAGVIPHGAQEVLRSVLRHIARSAELGVWRPGYHHPGYGRLLAFEMGYADGEQAVEADLAVLFRAGVVVAVDGGLTVPLDFSALTRPVPGAIVAGERPPPSGRRTFSVAEWESMSDFHKAAVLNGRKGGRPRKGEPVAGQRELLRPSPVQAVGFVQDGLRQAETQMTARVREMQNPTGSPGFGDGFFGSAAYSSPPPSLKTLNSMILGKEEEVSSEDARGCVEPSDGFFENPSQNPAQNPTTENPMATEVPTDGDLAARAFSVADQVCGILGIDGSVGMPPSTMVSAWLQLGATGEQLVRIARDTRAHHDRRRARDTSLRPIGSINLMDRAVRETLGVPLGGPVAQAEAAAGQQQAPPTFQRPGLSDWECRFVAATLRTIDSGDARATATAIARLARRGRKLLRIVVEERPELGPALRQAEGRAGGP